MSKPKMKVHRWDDIKHRRRPPEKAAALEARVGASTGRDGPARNPRADRQDTSRARQRG